MLPPETKLIQQFFDCPSKLLDAKVVRSDKLLGDIGEWLCVHAYGLVLETSGRHPGYDGKIGKARVQVKVHNSPHGTNLSVGNPDKYDKLIVILGPRSCLRVSALKAPFHAYHFSSHKVKAQMQRNSGFYCAKGVLSNAKPEALELDA